MLSNYKRIVCFYKEQSLLRYYLDELIDGLTGGWKNVIADLKISYSIVNFELSNNKYYSTVKK